MSATSLSGRSLSRDLATGILGSAVFGVSAAAGHSAGAMLQGAWVAPALFVGGAALATPPLYLFGALSGGQSSVAGTLRSTSRSLAAAATALLGLSAPALYLSVTMHTDAGKALLVLSSVVVGAAGVAAVLRERLRAEQSDGARVAAVVWCAFALMLGGRLITSLGRAAGIFGGVLTMHQLTEAESFPMPTALPLPPPDLEASGAAAGAPFAQVAEAQPARPRRTEALRAARAASPLSEGGEPAAQPDEDEGPTSPALSLIEHVIRSPRRFLEELDGPDLLPKMRTLLATVALAAGAFGAVVGTYRGGVQVLYCAIKMPLLLLGTLVVCVPAFIGVARAFGVAIAPRDVAAVTLGACARYALVLSGLSPIVWLLEGWLEYHGVALIITACCALAGLSSSSLIFRGLSRRAGAGAIAGVAFVAIYSVVGAQTAWLLRPFLVRPRTEHVPFVRPLEGDLFGSVGTTARSAAGIYDEAGTRPAPAGKQPAPPVRAMPVSPEAP